MSHIVLLSDQRVANVPVIECGEILCDLREIPALRLDPRRDSPDGGHTHVRTGMADRLVAAQSLLPSGLRLLVVEGYRPVALQRRYFTEYCARLAAEHPDWTPERVHHVAGRHVTPPEADPHATGGAVDLTVYSADGAELPMGSHIRSFDNDNACYAASTSIPTEARANMAVLARVLGAVGLVNCPAKRWHWSYGDRYWAFVTGRSAARYGPVPPPPAPQ